MSRFECQCGFNARADDIAALTPTVHEHFSATHPEFGVNETNVRSYLMAEERMTGSTERRDEIGGVEIREVGRDLLSDIQHFFDFEAFAGNPAWASCYCMFHHLGGRSSAAWLTRGFEENKADMTARLEAGTTAGVLAYVDGNVAGWCNASPRSTMPEHAGADDLDDATIGAIACFVVAPPYRRHGIARIMLAAATDMLARRGFAYAEGYPTADPQSAEAAYHGTPELFAEMGYEVVAEGPVMRRTLQ